MADETLVRSAAAGDGSAFAELVARHKARVFALASRFTRDSHQLEDLAQETFLRAWQRLGQYRGEAPFEHWLVRIAVHVCYDFLRSRKQRFLQEALPLDDLELPAPGTSPAAGEARELVEAGLARLAPKERLVLTLLELEDRSVREVAALTGWSEANVKVRAHRAREALRKVLRV